MNVLLTVGNGMMGDDGAGVLLAQLFHEHPLENWTVVHGGSAPENVIHQLRHLDAERVLVVDAADMDMPPGSVRRIPLDLVGAPFWISTHTLPLSFMFEALREFVPQVDMIGIQPGVVAFGFPMSMEVRIAVKQIYTDLMNGVLSWDTCN